MAQDFRDQTNASAPPAAITRVYSETAGLFTRRTGEEGKRLLTMDDLGEDGVAGPAGEQGVAGEAGEQGPAGEAGTSGLGELGSIERTSDFVSAVNSAPGEDIPLMTLTFTVGARPVYVFFGASDMSHPTANTLCHLSLYEGVTLRGLLRGTDTTVDGRISCGCQQVRFAEAGEHTVRLTTHHSYSTGAVTVYGAAGGPIYLRAVEA